MKKLRKERRIFLADSRESKVSLPYVNHVSIAGDRCFYCGGYGDQVDHFPPISQIKNLTLSSPHGFRIRACLRCNWNLSDSVQSSIEERKKVALNDYSPDYVIKKVLPRFDSKEEKMKWLRMDRMLKAIARGEHWAGEVQDPQVKQADDWLNELKEGKDGKS